MTAPDLDELAEQIMREHLERLDLCQTVPIEPRGRRRRKRPNTAIIAEAARERIKKQQS